MNATSFSRWIVHLQCILLVAAAVTHAQSTVSGIVEEEDFFIVEDSSIAPTDSTQLIRERTRMKKSFAVSLGLAYAPMLWIKEGYFDSFGVPHGIFDNFKPWFFSGKTTFAIKPKGSRISFGLPLSFMYNRNSSNEQILVFMDADTGYDSSLAIPERIDRSLSLGILSIGASSAIKLYDAGRISFMLEPELSFVVGFSSFKIDKSLSLNYFEDHSYTTVVSEKKRSELDYAIGANARVGLCIQYKINERISLAVLPYLSRLWSSVLQNKDQEAWIVSGVNGDEYEMRLNSIFCGAEIRMNVCSGTHDRNN